LLQKVTLPLLYRVPDAAITWGSSVVLPPVRNATRSGITVTLKR
jgi:hypothetical protein